MERTCEGCGKPFEAVRASARSCSPRCRQRRSRSQANPPVDGPRLGAALDGGDQGNTVAQVRKTLEAAGRAETYLGAAALDLAARIDTATAVMGFAPLVNQLQKTMDAALEGTAKVADALDELRLRRDRKHAG